MGYTILARLIQSCKSLETFIYDSAEDFYPGDSDPATIIKALYLHKDSLKLLVCDFRWKKFDEDFDDVPKIEALEDFSCLERISVTHD